MSTKDKLMSTDNPSASDEPRAASAPAPGSAAALDSVVPTDGPLVSSTIKRPLRRPVNLIPGAGSQVSSSVRSAQSSRRSASTNIARKLAAEAELRRRQLEREKEVEEIELQATLAAIEAGDSGGNNMSRTTSWVESVRSHHSAALEAPTAVHDSLPPPAQAAASVFSAKATDPHLACTETGHSRQLTSTSVIAKLASAVAALAESTNKKSLPTFSGNYKEWLAFRSIYKKTKCHFSPTANLSRLGDALRGPAREAVDALLHTAEDPEDVLRALEQTYGRPEIIVAREIAALRTLSKVSTPEQLNTLANKVRNCIATIKALKQNQYLYSPEIFRNILSKLNELTKARFTDFAADFQEENAPKLDTLSLFLLREADRQLKFTYVPDFSTLSSEVAKSALNPRREYVYKNSTFVNTCVNKEPRNNSVSLNTSVNKESTAPECIYCRKNHNIRVCKDFTSLSIDDRWLWVREAKICYRCLKGNPHKWSVCRAKRCGVNGCARRHHSSLHGAHDSSQSVNVFSSQTDSNDNHPSTSISNEQRDAQVSDVIVSNVEFSGTLPCNITGTSEPQEYPRAHLKMLPVVVRGPRGEYETYALLDDGSSATLIDAAVSEKIGANEECKEFIQIHGVGGMSREATVERVKFYIRGRNMNDEYFIQNARSIKNLSILPQTVKKADLYKYEHLNDLVDLLTFENATPTILIGAGDWHLSIGREVWCGKSTEPVATRTLLGWTLHGFVSSRTKPVEFVNYLNDNIDYNSVEALMREQYRLDSLGIMKLPPKNSEEDQRAIDILEATARRLPSGRFEVGLPWRHKDFIGIPDSYPQALSRFISLEKQFAKGDEYAKAYRAFIDNIIKKGYAEECAPDTYYSKDVSIVHNKIRWYLPHFGIYHPQKKKLRVVHDAAATTKGVSLNSLLLVGPDLLQSLLGILFRFREGRIAVTGDVREMFPQVKIRERDRDAQRFLWRDRVNSTADTKYNIKEYRMSSMIFGAVSSPFTALYIKNKNALEFQSSYPEATSEIIYNHYMDDYIASFDNLDVAAKTVFHVFTVHSRCCFEMRSWLTNESRVLNGIPPDLWANPGSEAILPTDVSALGIIWNPKNDTLGFRTGDTEVSQIKLTKRIILSRVMKVYDPLGLLTPAVIKGRILIQDLWRQGLGWDDEVPQRFVSFWSDWVKEIVSLSSMRIPRWYLSCDLQPIDTQLHLFSDASEQAYACVAYWRFDFGNGRIKLCLIGSKARVTPLKPSSIPRLELQAALIAMRLAKTIIDSHKMKPASTFYWTDSTTVLKWLRGDARRYMPFVAHRVGEILEFTDPKQWRWLPSELNVADDATRTRQTDWTNRWFGGPSFLQETLKEWPVEPKSSKNAPLPDVKEFVGELVGLFNVHSDQLSGPPVPDPNRFSVWLRLLRATARVIVCAKIFRSVLKKSSDPNSKLFSKQLLASDMLQAEKFLLIKSQVDCFGPEILDLLNSKPICKTSRLSSFSPKLCNGLLVMDSRIKAISKNEDPSIQSRIILDDRHKIVRLLIAHHHNKAGHGFNELVFNDLRARFWILGGRRAIKGVAMKCRDCARRKRLPIVPPTGDLPVERLDHHTRPFTNVGLDYFGPLDVTVGRRHEKRYVALYTCLVTRALHLEIVMNLSSDAAIMSLRRFIARRGSPTKILSDNGTAFVGASRELASLFGIPVREFATNNMIEWVVADKISWKFLPPASPFMAGVWERMVRTVKTALKATLREKSPNDEVFHTFLLEAESLVNSRPLTYIPSADDFPQALTPFHFLHGSTSNSQWLAGELDDGVFSARARWKQVLRLADHFWSRWLREYLPTLIRRRRSCTTDSTSSVQKGDVVVIVDSALPRGVWPLGRIVKTYTGPDNIIRVAEVATRGGILKRPVRKIVNLDAVNQAVATP